jgi:hypothetical protein
MNFGIASYIDTTPSDNRYKASFWAVYFWMNREDAELLAKEAFIYDGYRGEPLIPCVSQSAKGLVFLQG